MTTMSKLKRKKGSVEESRSEQQSRIKKSNDSLCTGQDRSCSKTSTGGERWWESSELSDVERLWALTLRALCPSLQSDQEESVPQLPPPSSTTTPVQKVNDWSWCRADEYANSPPDLPAPSFLTHSPPVDCKNPSRPAAAKNMGESDPPAHTDKDNYTSSPDQESVSVCDIQTAQQRHLHYNLNCIEVHELPDKHGNKCGKAGKVSEMQELSREFGAGLDVGSRARGSGAGLDAGSRAGGSGAGLVGKSRAGGSGAGLDSGSRAGGSGAGLVGKSRAGGSGAGLDSGSRAGGSGAGLVGKSRAGRSGAGLDTGSRAGGSGTGLDVGSMAGGSGAGLVVESRAGGSGAGLDAGSRAELVGKSRAGRSGAGLDTGSRAEGSGAGLVVESRAGGSGAVLDAGSRAGGSGSGLGTIPGTESVSVMGTKKVPGVSGSGQRAKSGVGGSGTGQWVVSGGSELGLKTNSEAGQVEKSGLEGSGSGLGRNSGAGGSGLEQGTKSGPEGCGAASGSGLECCPMCLMPFPEGFTQLECDGHLAQCLSEMHDDIIW